MCLESLSEQTVDFVVFPAEIFAKPVRIDWRQTEELYRLAHEQARAVLRQSIADRLAPYWN